MANVTIKLTVDTTAILNNPKNPDLPVNCRLSQSGGEDIGDYMVVDLANSTENISHLTVGDVITWQGIPANGDTAFQINILSIEKDPGSGSVLGIPVDGTWVYGKTVTRQVTPASSIVGKETYTINFSILSDGESVYFGLDPKMQIHAH
jgi:hypothetical protein